MIIAYYPGAGGNKYYCNITNREWQTHHQGYDLHVKDQEFQHRYLYHDSVSNGDFPVILTHCMNTPLIQKIWPNLPIFVILADMHSCLRRQWLLYDLNKYLAQIGQINPNILEFYEAIKDQSWPMVTDANELENLPLHIQQEIKAQYQEMMIPKTPVKIIKKQYFEKIDSACSQILWHKNYYHHYPLDLSQAHKVIDINGTDNFAAHMKIELGLYKSEIFDDCWKECHSVSNNIQHAL